MKTLLSSITFSLLAASCCFSQEFSITGISWTSKDSGKLNMNATIKTPQGCTISVLHPRGFLVSDNQRPDYMPENEANSTIRYSVQGFHAEQRRLNLSIMVDSIPEDGSIRIDDSLSLISYQGHELSPAHPLAPVNQQTTFYYHGYQYQLVSEHLSASQYKVHISSTGTDPAVESYRILDHDGSQIAQIPASGHSVGVNCKVVPHSVLIVRKKNLQQIDIPLQKDIKLTGELLAISKGSMQHRIVPQTNKPEAELTEEERDLLQKLPAFTLSSWCYSENKEPSLQLSYKSPRLAQHPFTMLNKDFTSSCKLSMNKEDSKPTSQNRLLVSFHQFRNAQDNEIVLTYRGLNDLSLDEELDIKLAYGELHSKRHQIQMHERGEIYLKDKTYHYEVKAGEPAAKPEADWVIHQPKTDCCISITCDQKEDILPKPQFFDQDGKEIKTHSARNYVDIMQYLGKLPATPHSMQLSQNAGQLDLKAGLKATFTLPIIAPLKQPSLIEVDNPTKEQRVEPAHLIWWRENQEQIKLIVRVPHVSGYEQKLVTPFGYLGLPKRQKSPKEGELCAHFNFAGNSGWTTRPHWLTIVITNIPESGEIKLRDAFILKRRAEGSDAKGDTQIYALDLRIQLPEHILDMMKGAEGPVVATELAEPLQEGGKEARELLRDLQFGLDSWQIDYSPHGVRSKQGLFLRFRRTNSAHYIMNADGDGHRIRNIRDMLKTNARNGFQSTFNHDYTAHDSKQWCNICSYAYNMPRYINYQDNVSGHVRFDEVMSDIKPFAQDGSAHFSFQGCEYSCQYDEDKGDLMIQYYSPAAIHPRFRIYYEDGTSKIAAGRLLGINGKVQFSIKTDRPKDIQLTAPQWQMKVNHPIKFQFELPTIQVGSH